MKKTILLSFLLVSALALAQTPNKPENTPSSDQQPTAAPTSPADQSNQNDQTATDSAKQKDSVMRGCLTRSSDHWILTTRGHNVAVSGDDSILQSHDGQKVEIHGQRAQGTETSSPSFLATSVTKISDSCK